MTRPATSSPPSKKANNWPTRRSIPTLAAGALALGTMGVQGAAAVLNSDMGTGIRMAAPLAMLSTLALCSQRGVLVKDGRALDLLCEIDTVLFDKTGTLTRERPEVGRIIAANGYEALGHLALRGSRRTPVPPSDRTRHPADERPKNDCDVPRIDTAQYKVGHGITVGVEGHTIRVGSRRFMEMEGVALTPEVAEALEAAHREGHSMVMVAVDDALGGALELRASIRPEVPDIIKGLRARGIRHIAIISGDHEAPTRKLAEELGIDRYFAQVLPTEKADYVEKLQKEGRKVCFVGDGINDAIALKKANVSISLRGATSIATDTAHVVFMEPGTRQALRIARHRHRAAAQRAHQLGVDPGAQHPLHRRRVHARLRDRCVGADQQRGGAGRAAQRRAADAKGRRL